MKMNKDRLLIIASYICLVAVIVITIMTYYNHNINGGMHQLMLSDTMWLPTLFEDLLIEGGRLSDWTLAQAPYFFPDMLIYFLAMFLTADYYSANILYIIFQLCTIFYIIRKIYCYFFDQVASTVFAAIVISVLYLVPTFVSSFLTRSSWHFGATLIGLIILWLMIDIIIKGGKTSKYLLLILFSSLIVASDKLFILQFMTPIVGSLVIMVFLKAVSLRVLSSIFIIFVVSVIFGELIYQWLINGSMQFPIKYSLTNLVESFPAFITLMMMFAGKSNLGYVFAFLVFHIISVIFFKKIIFKVGEQLSPALLFIIIYMVSMTFGVIFVVLMSSMETEIRYLLPIMFLPIIFFPILFKLFSNELSKNVIKVVTYLMPLVLIFVTFTGHSKLKNFTYKQDFYPSYVACIDDFIWETGAKYGASNYGGSKHLSMLTKTGVKFAHLSEKLHFNSWVITTGWKRTNYDLVLIDANFPLNPSIEFINSSNNTKPSKVKQCDYYTAYYYENGFDTKRITWDRH